MCGEKYLRIAVFVLLLGSPPHVRGKGFPLLHFFVPAGITPAYAGKRKNHGGVIRYTKDHPRVCGEKTKKIP